MVDLNSHHSMTSIQPTGQDQNFSAWSTRPPVTEAPPRFRITSFLLSLLFALSKHHVCFCPRPLSTHSPVFEPFFLTSASHRVLFFFLLLFFSHSAQDHFIFCLLFEEQMLSLTSGFKTIEVKNCVSLFSVLIAQCSVLNRDFMFVCKVESSAACDRKDHCSSIPKLIIL